MTLDACEIAYRSEALNLWRERFSTPKNWVLQRNWDLLAMIETFNALLESSEPRQRATLLAASQNESGAWLEALPSQQLGTFLDKHVLQISVFLRIFSEIYQPHSYVSNAIDRLGHHGLSYIKSTRRFFRHKKYDLKI